MSTSTPIGSIPMTQGNAGRDLVISIASVLTVWVAMILFLLSKNEYISFAIAAVTIGSILVAKAFAPNFHLAVSSAIKNRIGVFGFVSILMLLVLPFLLRNDFYWIHILTMVFILSFAAQGLNVHLGEIGAINVGFAGFFAIGAYTAAILGTDYGVNFWLTLIYATITCWIAGLLIGVCTIRTTGDYLSLVTLGFGLIIYQLAVNMTWLTHGTDGIHLKKPSLFGHSFAGEINLGFVHLPKEANFYYLSLALLLIACLVMHRTTKSWIGRTWAAMRQDSVGTGCFGVNVPVMQVISFGFGSSFAGIAGALYANEIGFIEPGEFTIFLSITLICMVILGGMGNWWGVILGAFIMIVIPEKLRDFQEMRYFLYGLVLLFILIYRPYGVFPSARRKFEKILG